MSTESDYWATADMEGEQDDCPMEDLGEDAGVLPWYRAPDGVGRIGLEEFSYLRLHQLGCTEPIVLELAKRFDESPY